MDKATDETLAAPSEESMAAALKLAKRWWHEGKLSYNWKPEEDVKFLAAVIENKAVPNAKLTGTPETKE